MKFKTLLCSSLLSISPLWAVADTVEESEQQAEKKDTKFAVMPVPVTDDALGAGLGVNAMYIHERAEGATKPSVSFAYAQYTDTKSYMGIVGHDHMFANDAWRAEVYAGYFGLNLKYYGAGGAPLPEPAKYASNSTFLYGSIRKQIIPNLYAGIHALYSGGRANLREDVPDDERKVFNHLMGGNNSAAGFVVSYDTRDNFLAARKGLLVEAKTLHYRKNRDTGKPYHYANVKLNHYIPLGDHVLAYRIGSRNSIGNVPIYQLAHPDIRGFDWNKYKGNAVLQGEVEYRHNFNETWGGVVFAGAAAIGDSIDKLFGKESRLIPSAGIGARYTLNREEGLVIGADIATSEGNGTTFYLRFGEAF
ncbi:hypothetical protein [Paraferrimonas sedimenticola]|uniref:Membrane protein n=1 Tax=Paraferrimonas sedimenticola TaxID=375674 RepID=A0AA37VU55_9GAMM|nr:hypothetical protein [Paraferrimonas sedimenticola]GLP95501.1 membrane protein [Paraferrimonas sedimenticola]